MGIRCFEMVAFIRKISALSLASAYLSASLLITISLSGCGKGDEVPDPPHAKAQLISELFSALRNENYNMAYQKIKRLKEVAGEDSNLSGIEETIINNIYISQAQAALDEGNIDGAIKLINAYMEENGQNSNMLTAVKELNGLKLVKASIDEMQIAEDSRGLAVSAGKLSRIISTDTTFSDFKPLVDKNIQRAREMREEEIAMAVEDIKADIDVEWVSGSSNIDELMAVLAAVKPDDSEVMAYEASMGEGWKKIPYDQFNPSMQLIYFRQAMNMPSRADRNALLTKILSVEPGSFSSLLMHGVIEKIMGQPVEETNKIFGSIENNIPLKDGINKQWVSFVPAAGQSSFRNVNPFIAYPYYSYFFKK